MGCNPFGGVRTIQHEIENCIHASFGHFTNSQFANFMARYSTGSCKTPCDSNDQTCRKDVKADLMRGICTGNPFKSPDQKANNPHFPAGIRAVYNLVVPPGSHGALIEYSGKPVSPKPLVTQTDARDRTTPLGTSESIGASIANPVYYSQCDQSWGDKHMRGCASFCKVGCAITSAAMIYSTYSDSRVTPDIFLNKYLKYYSDCNIESTALKKAMHESDSVLFGDRYHLPLDDYSSIHSAKMTRILDGYLNVGSTLFIQAKINPSKTYDGNHFVWIIGKFPDGGYKVMDPYWNGKTGYDVPLNSRRYASAKITDIYTVDKKKI
jgi:hypothetical protein